MFDFINPISFQKIDWLLDSEEKVREARISLDNTTEELFEEFKIAKIKSWQ